MFPWSWGRGKDEQNILYEEHVNKKGNELKKTKQNETKSILSLPTYQNLIRALACSIKLNTCKALTIIWKICLPNNSDVKMCFVCLK